MFILNNNFPGISYMITVTFPSLPLPHPIYLMLPTPSQIQDLFFNYIVLHTHRHTQSLLSPFGFTCLMLTTWDFIPFKEAPLILGSHWLLIALHLEVGPYKIYMLKNVWKIHVGVLNGIIIRVLFRQLDGWGFIAEDPNCI